MRCTLLALLLAVAAPSAAFACDDPASPLFRVNRDAVVEQPAPPAITNAVAKATLSPTIAGGCFDDACPDASAVTFTVATEAAGNFGYEVVVIDGQGTAPFIQGAAYAAENVSGQAAVTILWSADNQNRGEPFTAQIRTINLKGDEGPWSDPIVVNPAPTAGRPGGIGLGWLSLLLLAGLRGRRWFSER